MNNVIKKNKTRNIFYGALIALFLTAWGRAVIYYANRDAIQEMSRLSPVVASNNRDFVMSIQDPANIAWLVAPVIVTVLALVTLFLGIGHLVLIGINGVIGAILFAVGVFFPTTTSSKILAALFLVALITVVYLVVAKADNIISSGNAQRSSE